MCTIHHSPAVSVLLLMAAAATWNSFFPVADAGQLEAVHAAGGSCFGHERDALLAFKQGINDTHGYLRSWKLERQDCCRWAGITCSNTTGHVIRLDLGLGSYFGFQYSLRGQISPSLLSLEHLEYLSLSVTALTGPNGGVPEFLGSLKNLKHLDLSDMNFTGTVPPQLGNLSKLEYLDLWASGMYSTDISWLTRLPLLVHLDMSGTNLSSVVDWPLVVNMLPSLEYLSLQNCSLSSAGQFLPHLNLTNLHILDLSFNYFGHPVASAWFWNVTSIKYLYLFETSLYGPFPKALGNMTSLQVLGFGCFPGHIYPSTANSNNATMTVDLRNLCDLEKLWLDGSLSSGNITEFLEKLPRCPSNKLQYLDLSNNNMVGTMPDGFGQLTSLSNLDLFYNNITGSIPQSIGNLSHLEYLDLSYNTITGSIPQSIGKLSHVENLDLSNNHLTRHTPLEVGNCTSLRYLSLSNNNLIGPIPASIVSCTRLEHLDLSYNSITGAIPPGIGKCTQIYYLQLSNNRLTGPIPSRLGNFTGLEYISLSNNRLEGPIPLEIASSIKLEHLSLSNNSLTGHVPSKIGMLTRLIELDLSNNFLDGVIMDC